MVVKEEKKYSTVRTLMIYLDVIIAASIIIAAQKLYETQFGKVSLIFGVVMIIVTLSLKVLDETKSVV